MDFRIDLDWPQSGYEIITEWRGRRYCLQSREFWTSEVSIALRSASILLPWGKSEQDARTPEYRLRQGPLS
jgi:hypothetical protein